MRHVRQDIWKTEEVSRLVGLLTAERDRLERVLDALPFAVALTDGNLLDAGNAELWRQLGLAPERCLNRSLDELASASGLVFDSFPMDGTGVRVAVPRVAPPAAPAGEPPPAHADLFEHGPDPWLLIDAGGVVVRANAAASAAGYTTGHALAEWLPPAQELLNLARGGRAQVVSGAVEATARALPDGSPAAFLVAVRDAGPQAAGVERNGFEDRMSAVSRLAGGLSHELNNILTVITSYCHILLEEIEPGHKATEDVEAILKAAGDATQLGTQLVSIGRRHVFHEGPVDLNAIVQGLERTLRGLCGDRISVSVLLDPRLPAIRGDVRQIERAVLAMALHARDAMGQSGNLTVRTSSRTESAAVSLTDTRSWPAEAINPSMLEPYAPWPGSRRTSALDLAAAWSIVRQSGGDVDLSWDRGATTATLVFPLPGDRTEAAEAANQPRRAAGSILLVDDNVEIRAALRQMLERQGYQAREADSPEEALRLCRGTDSGIDLLISDINMPEMSGRELVSSAREARPGLRVIMMSGYADEEIDLGASFDDKLVFIQKPFSPERLLKAVHNLMSD